MDKITKRNIKLIQLLYSHNKFMSAGELAKIMGLSSKTIKLELLGISEHLKENDYGLFLTQQNSNYHLEREPVHYLDTLLLDLNERSTYFFITTHLFYNMSNLRQTFTTNYYSDGYFYKNKKKYEKNIQKYGLNLSMSPTHLTGDEEIIRFYFYSFYWQNYGTVEWPFTHIKKERAIKIIRKIEDSIQITFTEIEQLKLAYWIAIIVNRTWNQKKLGYEFSSKKLNQVKYKTDTDWMKFFFLKHTKIDSQNWQQERTFLLSMLLLIVDSKNWDKLIYEKRISYQEGDIFDFSIQFCKSIEKNFQLKPGMDWKTIVYVVYRIVYNQVVLNGNFDNQTITYKKKHTNVPLFNERYQVFISELIDSADELWTTYLEQPEIFEKLKYMVLNSLDIKAYHPSFKVYLCLTKGKLEEIIVMEQLNKLNYNLLVEKELDSSVDLVITDIQVKKNEYPERYFFWNDTSLENNITCLKHFLEKVTELS